LTYYDGTADISWWFGIVVTNMLVSINIVVLRQTRLVPRWVTTDRLQVGKPSRYVTSQLGRLTLLSSVGMNGKMNISFWA